MPFNIEIQLGPPDPRSIALRVRFQVSRSARVRMIAQALELRGYSIRLSKGTAVLADPRLRELLSEIRVFEGLQDLSALAAPRWPVRSRLRPPPVSSITRLVPRLCEATARWQFRWLGTCRNDTTQLVDRFRCNAVLWCDYHQSGADFTFELGFQVYTDQPISRRQSTNLRRELLQQFTDHDFADITGTSAPAQIILMMDKRASSWREAVRQRRLLERMLFNTNRSGA